MAAPPPPPRAAPQSPAPLPPAPEVPLLETQTAPEVPAVLQVAPELGTLPALEAVPGATMLYAVDIPATPLLVPPAPPTAKTVAPVDEPGAEFPK